MERRLWRNYPAGEINEKIEFWVDIWDDLIEHFTKTHYGLELANPHVALIVLIDEIEHNELRNRETRQYLLESLGNYLKHDPIVKQHLSAEFSLILQSFNNQPQFYLLQSVKATLPFFRDGHYFFETYSELRKILADSNWQPNDERRIESLASSLIVELLLKRYSLKSIQGMPRNIFCDTSQMSHDFPTKYVWNDFDDLPKAEQEKYAAEKQNEIKALNLDSRLSAFTRFFTRNTCDYVFIFEVEGLKGEAEFEIGPVTFYSPKIRSFIKDYADADAETNKSLKDQEFFRRDKTQYFANAAIQLSCIDMDNGLLQAAEMADKALDLLRSQFTTECRLKIVKEQHLILRKNGELRSSCSSAGESLPIKWLHSFDLKFFSANKDSLDGFTKAATYLFSPKDAQSQLEQKVSDCLHWFRKGAEADRLEDRLLHYWIVMEKIFTFPSSSAPLIKSNDKLEPKIFLISELLSASAAFRFIYKIGWTLRSYLKHFLNFPFAHFNEYALLKLPKEIIEKCFLQENYTGQIFLKQIVENLGDLEKTVDKRLVKNRVSSTKRFYEDGAFAKEEIKQVVARTKEDIILIYRYRNSIVHNAHYDPSLLQPFVEKAASLAQLALNMLISERTNKSNATVEQIFVSKYFEVQRIFERLDKNLPVDFLEVPTWNIPPP
jgi:hypothetical protein